MPGVPTTTVQGANFLKLKKNTLVCLRFYVPAQCETVFSEKDKKQKLSSRKFRWIFLLI